MDSAFLTSLLLHPSRRALLVLGVDGEVRLRNERAHELLTPEVLASLAPALAQARHQLQTHPEREIVGSTPTALGELRWQLRAVRDGHAGLQGYTLSLFPGDDAEALAEAPERTRWHFALESAQDGLWDWSAASGEVFRSARCFTMLGYRPEDFGDGLGDWQALLHPADRPRQEAVLAEHLQGQRDSYQVEYRVRAADGRWCWILDRGKVVAWQPDGRPQRVLGTHTDVTAFKEIEERLRERELVLTQAQHLGHLGSWGWDLESGRLWWSEELFRIVGLPSASQPPSYAEQRRLYTPESFERFDAALRRARHQGEAFNLEIEMLRPSGQRRQVVARGEAVCNAAGEVLRLIGVFHDVTEQRQAEEAARWRNDLLNRIARVGRIGGFELYLDSGELFWTEENYRIHGFDPAQPVSMASTIGHYDPASAAEMRRILAGAKAGTVREHAMEARFQRPDGQTVWLRIAGRLELREGRPYRITGLTQDITEEHEANERIEQLAHYDVLTGLPNRFLFNSRAQAAIEAAQRKQQSLALLFIDLDRFKNVNDSLGHQAGDALLVEVGGRIKSCVRGSDLVGRLSGDEFLVLLADMGRPQDAALVADKIIAALGEPVALPGGEVRIGCSVGIALLDGGSNDLDSLLRAADTAMYAAKDAGRNTWRYYDDSFFAQVRRRVRLEQELRLALANDELSLAYQPALDLGDGSIGGIEVLLRWRGPDGEWRSPTEFIPVAEETGEILPIGRWVLCQAMHQARAWDAAGLAFGRIAVNVSAVQLRDPHFAADVVRLCEETGWPPSRLELELTESALMRDSETLRRAFALFEQHGIALAVDDFGTGFSNLHYLHTFPVQRLKIDRSFVFNMQEDTHVRELCQAVISLGHALELAVTAEGVENERVLALLRDQGCDEVQGYHLSPPLPAAALARWLEARQEGGRPRARPRSAAPV